jgi:hypothetical protein
MRLLSTVAAQILRAFTSAKLSSVVRRISCSDMSSAYSQYWDRDDLSRTVSEAIMGDAYSWEALVEGFSPLVHSILRRYRLSEWDIADVSQNV